MNCMVKIYQILNMLKMGKIENSFKKGGANYKDEIGEINGGKGIYMIYIFHIQLNLLKISIME